MQLGCGARLGCEARTCVNPDGEGTPFRCGANARVRSTATGTIDFASCQPAHAIRKRVRFEGGRRKSLKIKVYERRDVVEMHCLALGSQLCSWG